MVIEPQSYSASLCGRPSFIDYLPSDARRSDHRFSERVARALLGLIPSSQYNVPPRRIRSVGRKRFGHIVEWHLDFHNAFCHEAFNLSARPHQPAVVIESPFLHAGLKAVRSISHLMRGDGIQ